VTIRVGINGLGCIGRDLTRTATDRTNTGELGIEIVAVDKVTDPAVLANRRAQATPRTDRPAAAGLPRWSSDGCIRERRTCVLRPMIARSRASIMESV
jgi:hypothetical protein